MAQAFPFVYISCPCSDASRRALKSKRLSREVELEDDAQDEEQTFDPRHPRSSFSLFPPEHLLYCEECHDIKCPRCVTEEIICTYCPSCLFEVPTSSVKQDYNRCARNCFGCPVCSSQLITTSASDRSEGPWILSCNYCMWTSLDIGIKFSQPSGIRNQMDQTANGGKSKSSYRDHVSFKGIRNVLSREAGREGRDHARTASASAHEKVGDDSEALTEPHARFEALKAFYKEQISASNPLAGGASGLDAYSSPASLTRIMSLYTSTGGASMKKSHSRSSIMREAASTAEGLLASDVASSPQCRQRDHADTPGSQQLLFQHPQPVGNPDAQHVDDLRPMPILLRTKRSKRCTVCKHILVKPEFKVTSTRYRIKLIALNYIPYVSLKPVPLSGGMQPLSPDGADIVLEPGKPSQWVMTLRNPLFENLSVSLGSPSTTPGKYGHRVTILCPQFGVGKNGDVWDDALNADSSKAVMSPGGEQIAGKIYEKGRNWTSIVIEVIPTSIHQEPGIDIDEDEDVIEIPVRVRLEWSVSEDDNGEKIQRRSDRTATNNEETDDGKRELAYWMVLGIGRVAHR